MEIRHLQHFIALAEEGKFTAAAKKMDIVQSGLSVTIKELEQELGSQLVNRTTRKVSLTSSGELFLQHARSSLAMLNEGINAVRSQDGVVRGRLHLGILQSLAPYLDLPLLLGTFRSEYPEVEFAVRNFSTETILAVRSGVLDLGFHALIGNKKWTGLNLIPFTQDSLVAICSRKHQLASQQRVELECLARERFVDLVPERGLRQLLDHVFSERNLKRDSVYEISEVDMMMHFVAEDLGVTIVPSAFASSSRYARQLHVLPIATSRGRLPKWRIVVVTRAERRHVPGKTTVDLFLETLDKLQSRVA